MTESRQTADEVRSLTRLAFDELGDAAVGLYGFHRAVATRAFKASGPGAIPARVIHDAISRRVYNGLGGAVALSVRPPTRDSGAATWRTAARCRALRGAPWSSARSRA